MTNMIDDDDRPASPYLEETGSDDGHKKYITRREKIHRIRSMVGYHAQVTAVFSPNDIWLQCSNHISDKLTLALSNPPPLEQNITQYEYVMTPIVASYSDKKLVRARILSIQQDFAVVRLIDTGKIDNRPLNQLYEMNDELRTHPWQAINVSLHNVHPQNSVSWTSNEIETLQSVLAEYDYVWVDPQLSAKVVNNDSDPIRVQLNGLSEEDVEMIETTNKTTYDEIGESIIDKYLLDLAEPTLAPKRIIDALDYEIYPVET